jgi:hypothetical protein
MRQHSRWTTEIDLLPNQLARRLDSGGTIQKLIGRKYRRKSYLALEHTDRATAAIC